MTATYFMRKLEAIAALIVSSVFITVHAAADELTSNVVAVTDGDTIAVMNGINKEKIRLAEIDSPEKKQPFGQQAKLCCSNLCFGKTVSVSYTSRDRDKRIIGYVKLPDGHMLNEEMVKSGMAWCYVKYCKNQHMYDLENEAKSKKIGLWQDPHPVPPWEWRKNARQHAKSSPQNQLLKTFGL